jgi:tetratricopeptide (TPR) repeat protein
MLFAVLGLAVAIGRRALVSSTEDVKTSGSVKHWWKWIWWTLLIVGIFGAAMIFRRSLASAWYANMGAVYQTWADLSPELDDASRDIARHQAITYFDRSLNLNPSQPAANRRFGMMALERQVFDVAVVYLSRAYHQQPNNQATLKALVLAYTWSGQLNSAEQIFQQLDDQSSLVYELGVWSWWWNTQGRVDLAGYAHKMVQRLSEKE